MDELGNVLQVHYHSGWADMAGYAQHLFQLQHDTQRSIAEQRCCLVGYAKKSRTSPKRLVARPRRIIL
jgi:hypothetical protein